MEKAHVAAGVVHFVVCVAAPNFVGLFYTVLSVAAPIFGRFYAVLPVAASKTPLVLLSIKGPLEGLDGEGVR